MVKRCIFAMMCAAVLTVAAAGAAFAAHKPVFTWQVRGDANYQQGIYDGDDRIAVLDMSTLDEPMQALMFFSKVQRPILLRHLKLTPGGKPLVQAVHLFWKSGEVITDVLDGLRENGLENNGSVEAQVNERVRELCARFPIYQG
jgi:opacity protein-like surface antigen